MNDNITLSDRAASPANKTFNLVHARGMLVAKDTYETVRKTDEFDDTPETLTLRVNQPKDFKSFRNSWQYRLVTKDATTGKLDVLRATLFLEGKAGVHTQAQAEAAVGFIVSAVEQTGARADLAKGVS